MSLRRQLSAAFAAFALGVTVGAGVATAAPTAADIVIDGDLADWAQVLTNPANFARDGEGSNGDCSVSSDRDCAVAEAHLDLASFAWTWDQASFSFMFSRQGPNAGNRFLFVYVDADADGLMETGEPVIRAFQAGETLTTSVTVDAYVASVFGGDALTDGSGFADGHGMPGAVAWAPTTVSNDVGAVPAQLAFEGAVPWDVLGITAGAPVNFHVGLAGNGNIPASLRDNMGGRDGGRGTTAWRVVEVGPGLELSVAPGTVARLPHRITNAGNVQDRIVLSGRSLVGLDVEYWQDFNGDDIGDLHLATDARGDGILSLPDDTLWPQGDTDTDGRLDTGPLGAGESFDLVVEVALPPGSGGLRDAIVLEAEHHRDAAVRASVTDQIVVGDLTLLPDRLVSAAAGDVAWFAHVLRNTTDADTLVDLSALSGSGWTWTAFGDPDADGRPADAVPLGDSDASGLPDLLAPADSSTSLLVRIDIPPTAVVGERDLAFVQAITGGVPTAVALDETTVTEPVRLDPDHLLADGKARHGAPGKALFFPHRITNARSMEDGFEILVSSTLGWPVTLLSDPDGDGRPYDAMPISPTVGPVPGNGGFFPFILRIDIPAGASVGDVERLTLTAVSAADPALTVEAIDEGIVSIVRAYEDPAFVVNISRALPCSTVHAQASGLPAWAAARFTWRDSGGTAVRVTPVTLDGAGEADDALDLQPGQRGDGWTVAIGLWDGLDFIVQDTAFFDVADDVRPGELTVAESLVVRQAEAVAASMSVTNESFDQVAAGVAVRWVVLSPDGSLYLDADGTFQPYGGSEATGTAVLDLTPRESQLLSMRVAGVTHPENGTYRIEAWRAVACGDEALDASATYEVTDDEDGDGLTTDEEIARGTDPTDADSDDDGIPDGAEANADSDGDGWLDPLDCDADDDGLPDGLEAGVETPHAHTDVGAGCFRPDGDPTTTTDPTNPDTDGGGVGDGVEDADGNGRVDPTERDPRVAGDDPCSTDPPDVRLDVARDGDGARLAWTRTDDCATHAVLASSLLPLDVEVATGLDATTWLDDVPLAGETVRYYRVTVFHGLAP